MSEEKRFVVKTGRFGTYFYDNLEGRDVDLNEILEMINVTDFLTSEEKGSELKVVEEVQTKTRRKYKIAGKPCKICGGLISWDDYDTKNKTGRPVHVDADGYKVGVGSCPAWRDKDE